MEYVSELGTPYRRDVYLVLRSIVLYLHAPTARGMLPFYSFLKLEYSSTLLIFIQLFFSYQGTYYISTGKQYNVAPLKKSRVAYQRTVTWW